MEGIIEEKKRAGIKEKEILKLRSMKEIGEANRMLMRRMRKKQVEKHTREREEKERAEKEKPKPIICFICNKEIDFSDKYHIGIKLSTDPSSSKEFKMYHYRCANPNTSSSDSSDESSSDDEKYSLFSSEHDQVSDGASEGLVDEENVIDGEENAEDCGPLTIDFDTSNCKCITCSCPHLSLK